MNIFVIVVTYNPMQWIDKCFNSLKHSSCIVQTIVVDNNSTDGSQERIKELFPEVELIQSNENLGFGRANNIGIKKAYEDGADYVFLLNQDAWVKPDTIEKLVIAQQREPEYGVISPIHLNGKGDALDYNFSNFVIPQLCKDLFSDMILQRYPKNVYELPFVNAAAWLISRECLKTIGGFNPSFYHYAEDDNYCQRLRYHGFKIGIVKTATIYHDRMERADNNYFKDKELLFQRRIILKASDLFYNYSFKKEMKVLYKEAIKSILFFRIEDFKKCFFKIKMIKELDRTTILKNREESRVKKPSFLY